MPRFRGFYEVAGKSLFEHAVLELGKVSAFAAYQSLRHACIVFKPMQRVLLLDSLAAPRILTEKTLLRQQWSTRTSQRLHPPRLIHLL